MALSKITNGGITGMSVSSTDVTVSSGDLLFGTAAKGVCLGVTSNTDGNTIDDYEEGTWTPDLTFGGGNTGNTYQTLTGHYTKIGDTVRVSCSIQLSNRGSSSGNVNIAGLPFAAYTGIVSGGTGSGNVPYSAGFLVDEDNGASWPNNTYALIWSDSKMYLRYNDGSGRGNLTNSNFSNSTAIYVTAMYKTSS